MSTTKKVPVTLVLHLEYEMPNDADDTSIKWRIEEDLCLDNLVKQVPDVDNDECNTCSKGFALVGHVRKEDVIRKGR